MKKIFVFCFLSLFSVSAFAETEIHDTEIENVLTGLIEPLTRAANIPDKRLTIHIVADDDFNAFVRGGEDVYVYTGLLKEIKSPLAFQAVIAHELGHSIGGHMVQMSERMQDEMKRALIIQALGVGLMVAGGNPGMGAGVVAGAGGISNASLMSFSRDEERMADNLGVDLMVRANLNPNGFIEVFEQMQKDSAASESKINPNNINHPLTAERIKNIQDKISKLKNKSNKLSDAKTIAKYEMVRSKLIGYLDSPDRIKTLYPISNKSDSAIYARAIAYMRAGNLSDAKSSTKKLISKNENNPYFYELLGDIEYQYGHYDDSVISYEHSLKLSKNAPQIQTALALVLSERKKPNDDKRAIELCKLSILSQPQPLTYWIMARVYKDGKSDWAMAQYYNMLGDKKNTKKYAKLAQKSLPKDSPEYIKSGDLLN